MTGSSPRVVMTIEARIASTRLPGKVLLEAAGEPLLSHLLRRAQAVHGLADIVVATTTAPADDAIEDCARMSGVRTFRGSEQDVLGRVLAAAGDVDVIVALTADNPVIDPAIVEHVLDAHLEGGSDITANNFVATYPDGMDVQVVSAQALRLAERLSVDASDREHTTRVLRRLPERFAQVNVRAPDELVYPELSVTVDEIGDYRLVKSIVEQLSPANPLFGCREVIELVRSAPDLRELNADVVRRY